LRRLDNRGAANFKFTALGPRCACGHSMLTSLRKLFATGESAPEESGGPVTLAGALARGWIELFYQPKIELRSARMVGAEGLVRARHPTRGLLGPGVFLPGASEADMLALTERVIIAAFKDWEACAANGMSLKLSVNVPVSALVKLPIAAILREERPRAPNWPGIIMEVTEDEIIHDLKIANEVADALRGFNCTLALDDFGAGYSSLARLRQLPFSELKIDLSYVSNCHIDRVNAGLCETISSLDSVSVSKRSPRGSRQRTKATSCKPSAARSDKAICSPSS
jgi:EAL domain-containing protein (putative c-di-GMP-specific phosphodiesterase class I)